MTEIPEKKIGIQYDRYAVDHLWFSSRWNRDSAPRCTITLIHLWTNFREVIAKIMLPLNQSSRLSLAPVKSRDLYIHDLLLILHLHNRGVPRCKNPWYLSFVSLDCAGVWLLFSGPVVLLSSLFYVIHNFDWFISPYSSSFEVFEVGVRNC